MANRAMIRRIVAVVKSINDFLRELKIRIDKLVPDENYPHDAFVIITLQEAITAAMEGNFGVGAVLIRNRKEIVQRGRNQVFSPYFRSDLHAEMNVMTKFEERHKKIEGMDGYTLFSSLEPCPMCLGRLITSGVREVYYAAMDQDGGMASKLGYMPNEWKELATRQDFGLADCSPELSEIALQVFMSTVEGNDNRLRQR
jgi:cytosine deaminase